MCALLAPDEIPLPLLLSQPRLLSEPLASTVADSVRHGEVAGILYRQGLLTWDPEAGIARIHRLVQDVILAHLPGANRRQRTVEAVELLAGLFPHEGEDPVGWPRCAQLLTHAQAVLAHAWGFITPATSDLLTYTGGYLRGRRLDMRVAQELDEQALAIRQRLYEGDHIEVAQSLQNLADDLNRRGEYARARELNEQALAMCQRLYEGDHPTTAQSLHNLANDLHMLRVYERATDLHEQALAMRQRLYEGDHLEVAQSLHNLAADLHMLGEFGRAMYLHEQALAMGQRLAGS